MDFACNCCESEIFYRLTSGRVCYSYPRELLYFTDSPQSPVAEVLYAVFRGLGVKLEIDQLHLDVHGVFRGAHRVAVGRAEASAVLTAMLLGGIQVSVIR